MGAKAFTPENSRIINMSPLRQWLIKQLDQLLCPGGVTGPEIRIDLHSDLFTALTNLNQDKYDHSAASMTCCTSFVSRVYGEARRAGGLPVVPKGQTVDDPTAQKYMPTFRMGDVAGNGPSSALRKAGCIYTWKTDPTGGPEPGDVYYVKDEKGDDKHISFVRQYLRGDMYETYDGGFRHVKDGIKFTEEHTIPEDRLWWCDIDAAMSVLGVWTLKPEFKPAWDGLKR